ncbi:unnamed protein product [Paramecium octaurelia]|uniref:Uncharacterized protein n=1 Tax=Paramecium octaurelia TaxID=43137 RepID=A0A8S1YN19_PAROT|nr:unnamed protein product [Paramecium octaurelia]
MEIIIRKQAKWVAYWKGKKLIAGGDYDEFQNKIGAWLSEIKILASCFVAINLHQLLSSFHIGNDIKEQIRGGYGNDVQWSDYNEKKNGNWTDLITNLRSVWIQYLKLELNYLFRGLKNEGQWNTNFKRESMFNNIFDNFIVEEVNTTSMDQKMVNGQIQMIKFVSKRIDKQTSSIYNKLIYVGEYVNGIKKEHWLTIVNGTIMQQLYQTQWRWQFQYVRYEKWEMDRCYQQFQFVPIQKYYFRMNYVAAVGSYFNGIRIQQLDYVYRGQTIQQ